MKLTKETLKQIIKEELDAVMNEANAGNVDGGNRQTTGGSGVAGYKTDDLASFKRASERDAAERTRQGAAYELNKKIEKAEAELKQLEKMNRIVTKSTLDELNGWKSWRQAKEAWRKSDKTRNDYTQTIGKVLIDQLDNKVKHLAKAYGSADLVKKVAFNWFVAQEAKYEAEIKEKKKSFLQRLNPFSEE